MRYLFKTYYHVFYFLIIIFFSNISVPKIAMAEANIVGHKPEGSLAITNSLDCISANEIKNHYTPADIYPAVNKCLYQERYQDAVDLFIIAGAYASFDELRVNDPSAHDAKQVLIINNLSSLDKSKQEKFNSYFSKKYKPFSKAFTSICKTMRRIGPPNYYPTYMIQYGTKAFLKDFGSEKSLIDSFNSEDAWKKVLDEYLHCI